MNGFYDDFDDFDVEDFGKDDSLENHLDDENDNLEDFEDITEPDDGLLEDSGEEESQSEDEFTAKDAFIIGGSMGFAYEEGLRKRKRRKRKIPKSEMD